MKESTEILHDKYCESMAIPEEISSKVIDIVFERRPKQSASECFWIGDIFFDKTMYDCNNDQYHCIYLMDEAFIEGRHNILHLKVFSSSHHVL